MTNPNTAIFDNVGLPPVAAPKLTVKAGDSVKVADKPAVQVSLTASDRSR